MLKLAVRINESVEIVKFEHSLSSMSKWEAEKEKPFFPHQKEERDGIDLLDYVSYMMLDREDEKRIINSLTEEDFVKITDYISSTRTATVVREIQSKPGPKENVTSELIYYWMISFNIPFEADQWHLNRLMTLIRVCSVKNSKQQKRPPKEVAQDYRELNAKRRAQLGTKG